ncbi:flagellin modification protein, PseA [Candidatus Omnitrophus magneticus]|uniref:Flagellin modification protein, PseA n=1 Tax=Candidatus Omnitrophus magneticus TaxID=1609969 RepID=A0A0F0CPJ5_9BACT|nr:flagellin modification protein, PseA [Candidatus Omnitrophus magneticus]
MKYCKKCVQPDTRPGIKFDEDGVCPPCRFAEQSCNPINWDERKKILDEIVEFGKKNNVSGYDCIIGVSGGKDSTRQALYLRDEIGLKPLLISCSYPPEQQTERGANNLANLISLGFDCISVSPDPVTWKKMMRQGFLKFGNWCKSTETALYASAPKFAIAYHIPLIFLGENPAIALGDLDVGSTTWEANRMKYCHTLKGGPEALLEDGITEKNLFWYRYPLDEELEWAKLRIVYLGYFIKDFTRFKNAEIAMNHGLIIRDDPPEDIGDTYGFEALDDDFVVINQMFKYLKFGFGKVTDQESEAVRLGKITREEAMERVKKYDGKCATRYIKRFCEYIEITEEEFWRVAESFRNKDIWEKDALGTWRLKYEF